MIEPINQLAGQSSPYLQLHQRQPVAWQNWQPEALALAQTLNRPILLSIGYSACHWCHVMARESFEDVETAALMNEYFINIKVDREERPDLDEVYQLAHQLLTGRPGGWPLTIFLCPQTRQPFLVGTYFAREARDGQMGFRDLLQRVTHYYRKQPQDFVRLRTQVEQSFQRLMQPAVLSEARSSLSAALAALILQQDNVDGGFGEQPKFPQPVNLSFLLQIQTQGLLSDAQQQHLRLSLMKMAERGINDRISGGFFRYSADAAWGTPHFEKMLYDNGLLLAVYASAWQAHGKPLYKSAALGIVRWLRQFMLTEHGTFFSAISAESEQQEGLYYLFSPTEIVDVLRKDEYSLFCAMFAFDREPNFAGQWHFSQQLDLSTAARQLMLTRESALQLYRSGRKKLEQLRCDKPMPLVDQKVLTGCNALVIKGLAILAQTDDELRELSLAQNAVDFIYLHLWINKRLFSSWQAGAAKQHAFLDDCVYLMDALLELLQTHWRDDDYRFVMALAESVIDMHEDVAHGGFFYTAHDAEALIYRSKPFMDSILPAANGVAARVFTRLGHLAAEPRYLQCAARTLAASAAAVRQSPETHLTLVQVQEEWQNSLPQVLLADGGNMQSWQRDVRESFSGRVLCYRIPYNAAVHPPEMLAMEAGEAVTCLGDRCLEPQHTRIGLINQLSGVMQI